MSTVVILAASGTTACLMIGLFTALWRLRHARRENHFLAGRLSRAEISLRTDRLTGLHNRLGARSAFETTVVLAKPTLLVLLDLDGFTRINDRYGHRCGDDLLTTVGARLRAVTRGQGGVAARLSGDEFLLLLPLRGSGADQHGRVTAILRALHAPVTVTGAGVAAVIRPAASAGATVYDGGVDAEFTDLLEQADIALHHARAAGDSCVLYDQAMRMPHDADRYGPRRRARRPTTGTESDGGAA